MRFIKLKFNQWPIVIGYVLVILMIATPWFLRPGYLFLTDNVWGPIIKLDWTSSWFLFNLLIKGLSFIFPLYFLEKIYITSILILILLGGRLLAKTVLEYYNEEKGGIISRGLIFALSLFALFNPFVYDRALYGQMGILISYGCLLFVVAYLLKTGQTLDFKNVWQSAIFSAVALMFSIHFIFLLAPFYLLFLSGLSLKRREIKSSGLTKKFWFSLLISLGIVLLLNANWLFAIIAKTSPLANFVERGITAQDLTAFQTAGATPAETFTNVLLMSGFWGKDNFRYLSLTTMPGWERSFIFLAPIIIYGVYLSFKKSRRAEKVMSLGLPLIFSLAVFLALGIKTPLTRGLTLFLYNHLPYYKGLREPQKWVAVMIPIYLFYLTLGAARLARTKIVINNKILSGIILAAIIIMAAPSLIWGFNRQASATPYPNEWYETNNFLVNRAAQSYGCSDKIIFLPWHLYMSFGWIGRIVANPAPAFFTCPVISGTNMEFGGIYDNSHNPDSDAVAAWLSAKGQSGLPAISGTPPRYIILAKEIDWAKYTWLGGLKYLTLIKETPTLLIYEIKS